MSDLREFEASYSFLRVARAAQHRTQSRDYTRLAGFVRLDVDMMARGKDRVRLAPVAVFRTPHGTEVKLPARQLTRLVRLAQADIKPTASETAKPDMARAFLKIAARPYDDMMARTRVRRQQPAAQPAMSAG